MTRTQQILLTLVIATAAAVGASAPAFAGAESAAPTTMTTQNTHITDTPEEALAP